MLQRSNMKRILLTILLPFLTLSIVLMLFNGKPEWLNDIIKYRVYSIEDAYSEPQFLSPSIKQASKSFNTIIIPVAPDNIKLSLDRLNWTIVNLDRTNVESEINSLSKQQSFYDTHIKLNDSKYSDISYCFAISNKDRHKINNVHWLYSQCRDEPRTFTPSIEIIDEIFTYKQRYGSKGDINTMYKMTLGNWHQSLLLDASALILSKNLQGDLEYNELKASLIELRLNGISDGAIDYEFNTVEYLDWLKHNYDKKLEIGDAYTSVNTFLNSNKRISDVDLFWLLQYNFELKSNSNTAREWIFSERKGIQGYFGRLAKIQ